MRIKTITRVAIAAIVVVIVLGIAWYANYRNFLIESVGMATCFFLFLYPQYKTERGVWMGGVLILLIIGFKLFCGSLLIYARVHETSFESSESPVAVSLGVVLSVSTFAFAAYATIINYRSCG